MGARVGREAKRDVGRGASALLSRGSAAGGVEMPRKRKPSAAAAAKAAAASAAAGPEPEAAPEETPAPSAEEAAPSVGAAADQKEEGEATEAVPESAEGGAVENPAPDASSAAEAALEGSGEAASDVGDKRTAESTDEASSPDRPRRRQKTGWDAQDAPEEGTNPSGEPATPSKKGDGPPPRPGDWVRSPAPL